MKELNKNVDFQLGVIYGYARARTEDIMNELHSKLVGEEKETMFNYILNEIISEVSKNYENRKGNSRKN